MANSNLFLSPYEILPIAEENKYLGKFYYFIMKLYVVCTHQNRLIEAILMSTLNIPLLIEDRKDFPELLSFASLPRAMIIPQWLELPMSRTIFQGPKDVRAIEVRLYNVFFFFYFILFLFIYLFYLFIYLFIVCKLSKDHLYRKYWKIHYVTDITKHNTRRFILLLNDI